MRNVRRTHAGGWAMTLARPKGVDDAKSKRQAARSLRRKHRMNWNIAIGKAQR
jgi:hypothetical protein